MKIKIKYLFIVFFLITGCANETDYDDDDVAVIVKGEETTVGELRFLYPDEKVLDRIDDFIKIELVTQEAKQMGIDISAEEFNQYDAKINLSPANNNNRTLEPISEFVETQAEKLGME